MESGWGLRERAMGFRSGLMGPSIRAIGVRAKPLEKENLPTFMEMSMMGNGRTIKPMAMVSTLMPKLVLDMRAIGKMICSMVLA